MSEIEKETIEVPAKLFRRMAAFLKSYKGDLGYHAESGFDTVNFVTCGTQSFDSDEELADYMEYLGRTIYEAEEVQRNMDVTATSSPQTSEPDADEPDADEPDAPSGLSL